MSFKAVVPLVRTFSISQMCVVSKFDISEVLRHPFSIEGGRSKLTTSGLSGIPWLLMAEQLTCSRVNRRPLLIPIGFALVGGGDFDQTGLAPCAAGELDTGRQVVWTKAVRN